jgi:hypothetical protein
MLGNQDLDYIKRYVACQAVGLGEDLKYKGKQDVLAQLNTFQKLAQLTGTGTWGRNLVGNASFGMIDTLSSNSPITLMADALVSKATGKRSQGFERGLLSRESRQRAKQSLERSILEVAGNIDLAEDQDQTKYDLSRSRTFDPSGAFSRVLSRWEQWNGYMLQSSDAMFKGMTEGSVRDAIIRANGWNANNLTASQEADLKEVSKMVAEYRTFQNKGRSAEAANALRDGINKLFNKNWKPGQFGVGTAIMPDTTVPTNIGVKALEFSPAGAVKGLAEMIKVGMDGKNASLAQQNQAVTDFGRGVTGTALIVGLAALMKQIPWFKDWEEEEDNDIKAQNKAEGKSGMQFNIDMFLRAANGDRDTTWRNGDRTVDISSVEPANQLITAASLMANGDDFATATLKSAKDSFMELPSVQALQNIENTIKYTDTPDDLKQTLANTAASTAGGVVGGFIPAPIRHASAAADEYQRDTSGNNAMERAWNQIVAATPWRQSLPVKTDAYGNQVTQGDLGIRLANQYLPNKWSEVNQSAVSREVERLRNETGIDLTPDRTGPKHENFKGGKEKATLNLGTEDRKAWKDANGKAFDELMSDLMGSAVYRGLSSDEQTELAGVMKDVAKDEVKTYYADHYNLPYDSEYDEVRQLDDPVEYLAVKKTFSMATKDENWNEVDNLIPVLRRMSQGDRDYAFEKDSTLGSYYDYLTTNQYGVKVGSAATVAAMKAGEKARAKARHESGNVSGAQDTFPELYEGYKTGKYSDQDIDAFMTKSKTSVDEDGNETTTWDVTKGIAATYLALRAGGIPVGQALEITKNADRDKDGTIDEKGVKIKAEKEGTKALQGASPEDKDMMWYAFNSIMYPYKIK